MLCGIIDNLKKMRIKKEISKNIINSEKFLKPEHRKPYQTTKFIYKALDIAEIQIKEQLKEIERLNSENLRLKKYERR